MHRMAVSRPALSLLIVLALIAAACTSTTTREPGQADGAAAADPSAAGPTGAATADAEADGAAAAEEPGADEVATGWRSIELTDVATGTTFTLADLEGQVVAIEPMAIWCPNCKQQQDNVKAAYGDLDAAGVRVISLGVDPNENARALAEYAERHGYAWTFARSPRALSRALSDEFGGQVLAVPSTPLIVLDPAGAVAYQDFGYHGPEELVAIVSEAAA